MTTMKKTFALISTLALCAGLASATTVSDAIVGFSDFDNGNGTPIPGIDDATFAVTAGTDYAALTGTTTAGDSISLNNMNGTRTEISLTLVLDTDTLTAPTSGDYSYIIKDASTGWGLGINDSGALTMVWSNGNYGTITSESVLGTGNQVITLTTGNSGTTLYVGETSFGTTTGLKFGQSGNSTGLVTELQLSNTNLGAVEQLYVFNSVLSANDVAGISQSLSVPEPATATLSLLALAGLAARRRRK